MSWQWTMPDGVFKNHALSSKIRVAAAADTQFMKFLGQEPGYGKRKGEALSITRYRQLPTAGRVSETDRLPEVEPDVATKTITVSEWGSKIPMTELEKDLTYYDPTNKNQQLLRDQMRVTMDVMSADALKLTPVKYIPTVAGGVFDTDGIPSTTADTNLSVADIRRIIDELRGNLKAPAFRNGLWVGILSTNAARGIKNDTEYKEWLAPTTNTPFVTGVLKNVENVMLIETNNFEALDNAIGTGGVLGEAVFFGADPGFLATVSDPELRMGLPDDLGRFQDVGWVGTLEAGLSWDEADLARVIHVTSA